MFLFLQMFNSMIVVFGFFQLCTPGITLGTKLQKVKILPSVMDSFSFEWGNASQYEKLH